MPSLGLSMIVKNGGEDLRFCIESARRVVDQIVIADTGSTDDSAEIAAEFGATVLRTPWENNFAQARNRALESMTTDWILVMDADEALEEGAGERIRALLESGNDLSGYTVPIRNYYSEKLVTLHGKPSIQLEGAARTGRLRNAQSYAEHLACRLFRRHPEIRYEGRVHEMVDYRIRSLGLRVGAANFRILHYGQLVAGDTRQRKNEFYANLLRLKVQDDALNPKAWYELASLEYVRFGHAEEALRCLYRAVELDAKFSRAWVLICQIHTAAGNHAQALDTLEHLKHDPEVAFFVSFQSGDLLHDMGRMQEARAAFRRAMKLCPLKGDFADKVQWKLGYTEVRLGRHKSGLFKMRQVANRSPHTLEHHDMLMKACVAAGDLEAAAEAAENTLNYFLAVKLFLRAAALRAQLRQHERERAILAAGLRRFPDSVELRSAWQRLG